MRRVPTLGQKVATMFVSNFNTLKLITAAALLTFPLAGCASEVADDETGEDAAAAAASAACTPAKYNQAFAHYRKAVYGAKARQSGAQVCEETGSAANGTTFGLYLTDVANEASAAVMTCAAFATSSKTSPYAEPLRKELATPSR